MRKMKKKDISLNISKHFARIFDHRFDLIKTHNEGTFYTIFGFWIFFPHPANLAFVIF